MDKIKDNIRAAVEAIKAFKETLKRIIWGIRYKRAINKAEKLSQQFRIRYYVLLSRGRLKCVPKQNIKRLIHEGRFKPGTKVQDVENIALYITKNF